jgi:hypothetical protein
VFDDNEGTKPARKGSTVLALLKGKRDLPIGDGPHLLFTPGDIYPAVK